MSNPILNSGDSSAVVATIRESTTMSPWTYNEKHRLVSPHSMNLLNVPVSSGSVGASKTFSFDVPKQGLAQGYYLNFTMPDGATPDTETLDDNLAETVNVGTLTGTANAGGFLATGILQCTREIRLETSGRVLEQMSRWQMLARYSDLPAGKKLAVQESLRMSRDPETNVYQCVMWLPFFGFREPERYAYNTSFCEPLRVIVSLDTCACLHSFTGTDAINVHAPTDAELIVHYRQLAAPDEDKLISANYSDGLLSRILSLSREEAVHTPTSHGSATTTSTTIELKENDCISAIYVMVECPVPAGTVGTYPAELKGREVPLEITQIALKMSGQDILNCPGSMIQYYGRWGEDNGENCGTGNAERTWRYVCKIDFSLGYKANGEGGGGSTVATREISSPRLVITFRHAAASVSHNVHVCYESTTFESTSSATGRVQLSISS